MQPWEIKNCVFRSTMGDQHVLEPVLCNLQECSNILTSQNPEVAAIGQSIGDIVPMLQEALQEEDPVEKEWLLSTYARQLKGLATTLTTRYNLVAIGHNVAYAAEVLVKLSDKIFKSAFGILQDEPMSPPIAVNELDESDDSDDAAWVPLPPTPPPPTFDFYNGEE